MIRFTLLLTLLLGCYLPALSQKVQIYQANVRYQKAPSAKLPPDCKSFQVYVTSNLPKEYHVYPGAAALQVKLPGLKRLLNDSADLRINVIIGDTAGPGALDPAVGVDADHYIVTGGIMLPVYYKLTDKKGMIYEEDSADVSTQLLYTTNIPGAGLGLNSPIEQLAMLLIQDRWEMALDQNIMWMNYQLSRRFFNTDEQLFVRYYSFAKYDRFGLDGNDKAVLNGMYSVLHQFGKDQDWEPVKEAGVQLIGYWKSVLEKTKAAWQQLKDAKSRQRLTMVQYDIYYNLCQSAIWARDTDQALYFLNQCGKMPSRDSNTKELLNTMRELDLLPGSHRF